MSFAEWLTRHITYPTHETLRGRRTLSELAHLERLAHLTSQAVALDTRHRLRALLQFAAEHLPYYRDRFAQHALNPRAADPLAELEKLPLLEKHDVRTNAANMTWGDVPGGLVSHVSGGTSGDTLHFFIDRVRQTQPMAARLFMQQQFGVLPGDRRVYVWASPIENQRSRLRHLRDRLLNEVLLNAFDMSAEQMDHYLRCIVRYRPRAIYGYKSAITLLARYAAGRYSPADFPDLRLITVTGDEVLPDPRDEITAVFGCPVANEYGSREVGLIAHECPRGGLHIIAPHTCVEVTLENRRLPPGQPGNITCTALNTRAQPLIRYRVGDVGTLLDEPCRCGLPFPLMQLTGARITGFIALGDGRLCHGALLSYLVRKDPGVDDFRVYQHTLRDFEILLCVNEKFGPDAIPAIVARFHENFGPHLRIDCRVVDHLPPDPSGKRRHIISHVAAEEKSYEVVDTPVFAEA